MKDFKFTAVLLAVLSLCGLSLKAEKTPDYSEFAQTVRTNVYAKDLPAFLNRELPQEYAGEDAVVLARYRELDVRRNNSPGRIPGTIRVSRERRIEADRLTRILVWINSQRALQEFSEFSFLTDVNRRFSNAKLTVRQVMGLKVIKPDGREVVIDADDFIEISEGKKGKDKRQKLAVPDLEVGDIVDFFYYSNEDINNTHLLDVKYSFRDSYPILDDSLSVVFDGTLGTQYRTLNDVPSLKGRRDGEGNFRMSVHTTGAKAAPRIFYNSAESTPSIIFNVYNPDVVGFIPKSGKVIGLVGNPAVGDIKDDLWITRGQAYAEGCGREYLRMSLKNGGGVHGFLKKAYNNGKMTDAEVADCVYNLMTFAGIAADGGFNSILFDICFEDFVYSILGDKLMSVMTTGVGNEPIDQLSSLYNAIVGQVLIGGNRYYFAPRAIMSPSEIQPAYAGRKAQQFYMYDYRKENPGTDTIYMALPETKISKNRSAIAIQASIDGNSLDIKRRAEKQGVTKIPAQRLLTEKDILEAYREYFRGVGLDVDIKEKGKKLADRQARYLTDVSEQLDEFKDEVSEYHEGLEVDDVSGRIVSVGVDPKKPRLVYEVGYKLHDMVKQAGRNQIVSIGRLIEHETDLSAADRLRSDDVTIGSPSEYLTKIELAIPEGATVGQRAIDGVTTMVSNSVGMFATNAALNDGVLVITVVQRFAKRKVPLDKWGEMLDLIDAVLQWQNKSVVISKKAG